MPATSHNLADALAALQRGDPNANNQLVIVCQARIERLARRMLRNHPECRDGCFDTLDLVQEASLSLAQALQTVRPESDRHLFHLAAIKVRHRMIDLIRKFRGPQSPIALRATNVIRHPGGDVVRSDQAASPATDPSLLEDWEQFHQVVDSLPENLKMTFSMRYYLGAKQKDVAQTLSCDERTVRRYWNTALEQIRQKLSEAEWLGGPTDLPH